MNLLSLGEIVWDVRGDNVTLGGAPLNLAVHTAMNGGRAFLVSAVGNDAMGHAAIEIAEKFSVDTHCISCLDGNETAKCTVCVDDNGLPSYTLTSDASFDRIVYPEINEYMDVICFGTLALRYESNRKVTRQMLCGIPHGKVFCDINLRSPYYSRETVDFCFREAEIIKLSGEELPEVARLLLGSACEATKAAVELCSIYKNIGLIIITLGADGSLCYDKKNDTWYKCGAKKIKVVSTVGAGDSFSAAFLVKYLDGCDIADCLEYASKISAAVCECDGAFSDSMAEYVGTLK